MVRLFGVNIEKSVDDRNIEAEHSTSELQRTDNEVIGKVEDMSSQDEISDGDGTAQGSLEVIERPERARAARVNKVKSRRKLQVESEDDDDDVSKAAQTMCRFTRRRVGRVQLESDDDDDGATKGAQTGTIKVNEVVRREVNAEHDKTGTIVEDMSMAIVAVDGEHANTDGDMEISVMKKRRGNLEEVLLKLRNGTNGTDMRAESLDEFMLKVRGEVDRVQGGQKRPKRLEDVLFKLHAEVDRKPEKRVNGVKGVKRLKR